MIISIELKDGQLKCHAGTKDTSITLTGEVPLLEHDKNIFNIVQGTIRSLENYCSDFSYHKSTASK